MLLSVLPCYSSFFFFNDTATTEIYTLSLHDALPISVCEGDARVAVGAGTHQVAFVQRNTQRSVHPLHGADFLHRSEEHTSELQSQSNLVCRLLLEKKKKQRHASTCHMNTGMCN